MGTVSGVVAPVDRPIIFSTPMVKALRADLKTQTRRLASSPLRHTKPGDRLWVREGWVRHLGVPQVCGYLADGAYASEHWQKNTPSIHMPRWASRTTLIVTDVRFQGLNDITEEDAVAEGFAESKPDDGFGPRNFGDGWTIESPGTWASAGGHFQILWAELHPKWDGYSNDPVVALTFRVVHQNIDRLAATVPA